MMHLVLQGSSASRKHQFFFTPLLKTSCFVTHLGQGGYPYTNICLRIFPDRVPGSLWGKGSLLRLTFWHILEHFGSPREPFGAHLAPLCTTLGAQGSHLGDFWVPFGKSVNKYLFTDFFMKTPKNTWFSRCICQGDRS